MKRKIISLLLTVSMLSSLCLMGCGTESTESGEKSAENVEKPAEDAEKPDENQMEEKTIQILLPIQEKQRDSERVWELFNEELQKYVPNTKVEFMVYPYGEYKDKYNQVLASGEAVDLVWIADWVTGPPFDEVTAGNLIPLDDLMTEYGQDIVKSLGEDVIDMHRADDGKLYFAVSWEGMYFNKRGIFIPTEQVELAGDTWLADTEAAVDKWWNNPEFSLDNFQAVFDQFDILLSACKDADKLYAGLGTDTFMGWNYSTNTYATKVNFTQLTRYDDSFTVVDGIQSDAFRMFAKNMAEYYQKGYIRQDIASASAGTLQFVNGGTFNENTIITFMHNNQTDSMLTMREKTAGVPLSVVNVEKRGELCLGLSSLMGIPYCADDAERAMMVLNELYAQKDLYQLLIYGIEGEHYTKNDDGTITINSDGGYTFSSVIGTCMNGLTTQDDVVGRFQELKDAEKDAYVDPFLFFTFDNTEVKDVVAALSAVDGEYYPIITTGCAGADWEETLDKWIQERKAAGVDKLIEEFQRQLDAYREKNGITAESMVWP